MAYKVRAQEECRVLFDFMEAKLKAYAGLRSRAKDPVVRALAGAILQMLLEINDKINMALEWAGEEE